MPGRFFCEKTKQAGYRSTAPALWARAAQGYQELSEQSELETQGPESPSSSDAELMFKHTIYVLLI